MKYLYLVKIYNVMLSEIRQYFRKLSVLKIEVGKKLLLNFFLRKQMYSQIFALFDNSALPLLTKKTIISLDNFCPKLYLILYPFHENLTIHIAITENLTKITMENDLNQGRID